ncbi:MAG: class I SAM-dependent methyltransferase [Planctomycetota bacterium]
MSSDTSNQAELTNPSFWDQRWNSHNMGVIQRGRSPVADAILHFMDQYASQYSTGSILEIGGAPGRYLARMAIDHDLSATAIDYSPEGCDQLRANFAKLDRPITVIERNVLTEEPETTEKYDVVFSLGLIEHFEDVEEIIRSHVKYLKDGGILILGVPNCLGIYRWFWKSLSPDLLSKHVLSTMEADRWEHWAKRCGIRPVKIAHVGGFDSASLDKREVSGFHWKKVLAKALRLMFYRRWNLLGRTSHPALSAYLIGAFQLDNQDSTSKKTHS